MINSATMTRTATGPFDDSLVQASLALAQDVEERLFPDASDEDPADLLDATLPSTVVCMIHEPELVEAAEDLLDRGIELCRTGNWSEGVRELVRAARMPDRPEKLPSLFFSYLGYGLAVEEGQLREGLRLCRYAVQKEFYQPENYLNLAHVRLLAEDREGAFEAVAAGLRIDTDHPELLALRFELGSRRHPMVPFLRRRNLVNRFLGRIRHGLIPE